MSMPVANDPPKFTKAEVRLILDGSGTVVNKTVTLTKAAQVEQLAKFFPEVGTGRKSNTAGSWKARVIVQFTDEKGGVHKVATNYEFWNSTGQGDWKVEQPEKLEQFVEEITKE
jgi:hypothetical protein